MQAVQKRNDEMVNLLTADLLSLDDRNVAFAAVDMLGNAFVTTEVHTLATVTVNTAPTVFAWDGSVLTLPEAGIYLLHFNGLVLNATGGAPAEALVWVEEDPATGVWTAIPGMKGGVLVGAGSSQANVSLFGILHTGFNYRYRVQMARNAGSDTLAMTGVGGSRLDVVRLYRNR